MYGNVFVYNFKNAFCKLTLQKKIICKVAATFRENMCKAYLPFSVGWFINLVFTTSAGVPNIADIKPEHALQEIPVKEYIKCYYQSDPFTFKL